MIDLARMWQQIHVTQMQTRDVRSRVLQTCWRAVQARQEAARTRQRTLIASLRQSMPGASYLTRAITAEILARRGLLDRRPTARAPTARAPTAGLQARRGAARAMPWSSPQMAGKGGRP
jgi:hypothetical protein